MLDMFPFPKIVGNTPEEQILSLVNYLVQFKEMLEFTLANISTENLSSELVNKLNELGANIEQSNKNREEEVTQLSNMKTLTVFDVCNSDLFKLEVKNNVNALSMKFNVNFENGHLEYEMSE